MDFTVEPFSDSASSPRATVQTVPVQRVKPATAKPKDELYPMIVIAMMAGRIYENPSVKMNLESYMRAAKLSSGAKKDLLEHFEALIHANSREQKDQLMGYIVAFMGNVL